MSFNFTDFPEPSELVVYIGDRTVEGTPSFEVQVSALDSGDSFSYIQSLDVELEADVGEVDILDELLSSVDADSADDVIGLIGLLINRLGSSDVARITPALLSGIPTGVIFAELQLRSRSDVSPAFVGEAFDRLTEDERACFIASRARTLKDYPGALAGALIEVCDEATRLSSSAAVLKAVAAVLAAGGVR